METITVIATCLIAVATVCYTIGTFLLWKQTRDAFKLNFIVEYYGKGVIEEMKMRGALEKVFGKEAKKFLE